MKNKIANAKGKIINNNVGFKQYQNSEITFILNKNLSKNMYTSKTWISLLTYGLMVFLCNKSGRVI